MASTAFLQSPLNSLILQKSGAVSWKHTCALILIVSQGVDDDNGDDNDDDKMTMMVTMMVESSLSFLH